MNNDIPDIFHPVIREWFTARVGTPTDIQLKAWPEISAGRNLLVTAPTGSGKTLCAFLYALNQLLSGSWEGGTTRVLYISPLKALNNDIRKNLLAPLAALTALFEQKGFKTPQVNVLTRSGDTSASERRRMIKTPPEILITTPESLNIMLTGQNARPMFKGIRTVILDEIHAIAGSKRGTHLITAVDRLVLLAGEFQRIALSATVRPLEKIAEFTAGYIRRGEGPDCHYAKREIGIITSSICKKYAVTVDCPDDEEHLPGDDHWSAIADYIRDIVVNNKSTLVFVNSRQFCEKITRLLNGDRAEPLAYAHHGSLSKEIRHAVEDKLKKGELRAIVATNSLELGIDVGELDEVVLVQTPFSLSSSIQRIGRAGHSVNEVSSGILVPTFEKDFVNAAVTAGAIAAQDIEEVRPVESPLDILTQLVLAMTAVQEWNATELHAFLKTSWPYRNLSRKNLDLVVDMLAGKYADSRIKELKSRIYHDGINDTIRARENALFLLYSSGGTIPDRGYYNLRAADSKAKIGELDEEFVWERHIGDVFTLGTQVWQIKQITQNDVLVGQADKPLNILPFWKADDRNRDFYYSEKLGQFLEEINGRLEDDAYLEEIKNKCFFSETAMEKLTGFLRRQKQNTGCALPSRHNVVIEYYEDPLKMTDCVQIVVHTLWGGMLNRPFVYALAAAWEEKYDVPLQYFINNDSVLFMYPRMDEEVDLFGLVNSANLEKLLRKKLEATAYFAAKFRQNAGRAMLLPNNSFRNRVPLWLTRVRSRKMMDAVYGFRDFPVLLETWRECLDDDFDLDNLKRILDEIENGTTVVSHAHTITISPFAGDMVWLKTNDFMYTYDIAEKRSRSGLSDQLIGDLLHSSSLRPRIPEEVINQLDAKLKREFPGYAPSSAPDLLETVKDRLLVPRAEWSVLCAAVQRDNDLDNDGLAVLLAEIDDRLAGFALPGVSQELICAVENIPRIEHSLGTGSIAFHSLDGGLPGDALARNLKRIADLQNENGYDREDFFLQWLGYHALVTAEEIGGIFGDKSGLSEQFFEDLTESGGIVIDTLREGSNATEICCTANLEILLRMARRFRQPGFTALEVSWLPLFLAHWQGLTQQRENEDELKDVLDMFFGLALRAELWEEAVLPARFSAYRQAWLDTLFQDDRLLWFGAGQGRTAFAFREDLELFLGAAGAAQKAEITALFPTARGKYGFFDLRDHCGGESAAVAERLWKGVWEGLISNDSIHSLRKGILNKFRFSETSSALTGRRRGFTRWQAERPLEGNWLVLDRDFDPDPVEGLELEKYRIRQLFARYGILFREMLAAELPLLQWKGLFRTLRLMELSGEILSGQFFTDIQGLQFITPEAFRLLEGGLPQDAVFWLNATDPASVCGVRIEALKAGLPHRQPSSWLVYHGRELVVTAEKTGRELSIHVPADHKRLPGYLGIFRQLLDRQFNPPKKIVIDTINGSGAAKSEYAELFLDLGFRDNFGRLELWRM
ncbi:MAG: DEAD/DEAH box helicase [Spirochaetales bacterium]|nr:DEAD/DEAH box helicase [Spirochaetales bacterium]